MKISIKIFILISLFFFFVPKVEAHPGNTASDGCHYCWTNCASWGEVYGARHCHGGGYTPPDIYTPNIYDPLPLPTLPPLPTVKPIPLCPLMSTYNYLTEQCECLSGYTFNGSYCISKNQSCTDKYGFNSTYDYLSNSCKCRYGYVWNNSSTKCISNDDYCYEEFGFGSKYDILKDGCVCRDGYIDSGNSCVLDTSDDYDFETFTPSIKLPSSPIPTIEPVIKATPKVQINTPKPTPSITSTPTFSPIPSAEIEENQEVSPVNKKESIPLWRRIIRFIFGV